MESSTDSRIESETVGHCPSLMFGCKMKGNEGKESGVCLINPKETSKMSESFQIQSWKNLNFAALKTAPRQFPSATSYLNSINSYPPRRILWRMNGCYQSIRRCGTTNNKAADDWYPMSWVDSTVSFTFYTFFSLYDYKSCWGLPGCQTIAV